MWYEYFLDRGLIPFPLVRYFINRLKTSIKNITDDLNKILERMILNKPEQWIWSHNRWK